MRFAVSSKWSERRLLIGLLCAAAAGSPSAVRAQQTPTFRSGVTLVTVDVSVLDKNGKPVPGLTAEDFEVKLDGHVQPVRVLTYEEVTPDLVAAPRGSAPVRETTNLAPARDPRVFVVMMDDLSISASRGKGMLLAAGRFVSTLPASDVVGFTTSSGMSTVNPTIDHAAVQAAIRRAVGQFIDPRSMPPDRNVGISEALDIVGGDNGLLKSVVGRECFKGVLPTQQQLDADSDPCIDEVRRKAQILGALSRQTEEAQIASFVSVINAMRRAPGLKHLLLISDGLALPTQKGISGLTPIARAAAEAGVQMSVLLEEPEGTSITDTSPGASTVRRADGLALVSGMETVADLTGGNFYRVIGTPDASFTRVATASAALYHLGVEAPAGSTPGRDFAVVAAVHRPGATVHANREAITPAPAVVVPIEEQLRTAVAKGLPLYGVPLNAATMLRRGSAPGELELGVNVEVPASVPGPITVVFGLVDASGTLRTGRKTAEPAADGSGYRVSLAQSVTPGKYHLRFAVADAGGHVGSIDAAVTAELGHVGPFLASDILTSWSGADGKPKVLALERVPSAAVTVHAFLELYPADVLVSPDVKIQWTLVADDKRTVDEKVVAATRAGTVLNASGEFALGALAPGLYAIRATVLVGGNAVGIVSTTIRKT